MRRFLTMRVFAVALAIALLVSCGGNGGGASGAPTLTITADSPPAGTTGQAYAGYAFNASGGVLPLHWTASGNLPPGLVLSPAGQLAGTPGSAATYSFTVTVSDSSTPAVTATAQVNLKIGDSAVVISMPATPATGTVTYPYQSFTYNVTGGSPPYTWKSSGTLPPGLTIGSDGTVSGTPTQVGSYSFSVTATDSAQPATSSSALSTLIMIVAPPDLAFSPTPAPPAGVVGTPYGPFSFNESGGYQPLHWSVTAGTLAPGLTLGSSDGSLSGTPTSAGTYSFTIAVTDSASTPVSQSLPFSITVTFPGPPTINPREPPTGTVGSAYTPFQLTASNGLLPLVWSEVGTLPPGITFSAQGVLAGTPTMPGQYPITVNLVDAMGRAAPPFAMTVRVSLARTPASFTATGSMKIPRSGHAATLLLSGQVLVTGGGNGNADPTAELYDPATGTFSSTQGDMTESRIRHTATLLNLSSSTLRNYGKVLIVGSGSVDTTAELYDPATSTFAATGSLHHARTSPTATLLKTDQVLIVGGNSVSGDLVAELYDPSSGTFSDTGSTTTLRSSHTATLLASGHVLIAGGGTASAELYDPSSGTFTSTTGDMSEVRSGHTATLLGAADAPQAGWVLIIGTDGSADLFRESTQTFMPAGSLPNTQSYNGHTASLRSDGTVLATGGYFIRFNRSCSFWHAITSAGDAALFAPESDGFTPTGSLNMPRDTQTATVLLDGTVLVAGGVHRDYYVTSGRGIPPSPPYCVRTQVALSSAELFK
jgi:hypothetical protein